MSETKTGRAGQPAPTVPDAAPAPDGGPDKADAVAIATEALRVATAALAIAEEARALARGGARHTVDVTRTLSLGPVSVGPNPDDLAAVLAAAEHGPLLLDELHGRWTDTRGGRHAGAAVEQLIADGTLVLKRKAGKGGADLVLVPPRPAA